MVRVTDHVADVEIPVLGEGFRNDHFVALRAWQAPLFQFQIVQRNQIGHILGIDAEGTGLSTCEGRDIGAQHVRPGGNRDDPFHCGMCLDAGYDLGSEIAGERGRADHAYPAQIPQKRFFRIRTHGQDKDE